jgi:hypothetical protein
MSCAHPVPTPLFVHDASGKPIGYLNGSQVFAPKVGCSLALGEGTLYVPDAKHVDVWWSGPECTGTASVDVGSESGQPPPWEGFPFACAYSAWADGRGRLRRAVFRVHQPVRQAKLTVASRANFKNPLEPCVTFLEPKQVTAYALEQVLPDDLRFEGPPTFGIAPVR